MASLREIFLVGLAQQRQQHTGVLFIITQQVQWQAMQQLTQSQQHWIILQQSASPLVQVMQQPLGIISHLHTPMVKLQQQTIMPFIMQQQETMPPASMEQRFCSMLHAVGSSQVQVIFMPPGHFSIFMVQRGTIMKLGVAGAIAGVPAGPGIPMPGMDMPVRSIIIVLVMIRTSLIGRA